MSEQDERIAALEQELAQAKAERGDPDPALQAYGQPGVGGGSYAGSNRGPTQSQADLDRQKDILNRMIGTGGGEGRNVTAAETRWYMRQRLNMIAAAFNDGTNDQYMGLGELPRRTHMRGAPKSMQIG